MAITPFPQPTPAGVVAWACEELESLTGVLWSARTSEELVGGVEELQRLKAKTAALEAELLAEIDVREVAKKDLAWGSTADWFTHTAGTTRRQGRRTVAHARILVSDRTATLQAMHEGTVSPDQAAVVVDALEKLPTAEQSSTPTAASSTWAAPTGWSPPPSGRPWSPATHTARSPAAPDRR